MTQLMLAAAMAFDLTCSVTSGSIMGAPPKKLEHPEKWSFRVNLEEGRYCDGDCRATQPIGKITPTTLYLRMIEGESLKETLQIDRASGALLHVSEFAGKVVSNQTGTCKVTPFTGLPRRKY